MQLLELEPRFSLYEPNVDLEYVYFPETGIGSIVTVLEGGLESEVATVGFEGMIGLSVFLGVSSVPGKAFWQTHPGSTRCSPAMPTFDNENRLQLRNHTLYKVNHGRR